MRELLLDVIFTFIAIILFIVLMVIILLLASPRCDDPDGTIVAFEADTTSNYYQIGVCQNGFINYEDIGVLKFAKKLKEE